MQFRTIVALSAGIWLAGCASGSDTIPTQPSLDVIVSGNPPPPPVSGAMFGDTRITGPGGAGVSAQYNFQSLASYNRNLTTGMNFLEFEPGTGKIRANATGVVSATGKIVMTDPTTQAVLTVQLSQLIGFTGALVVSCPTGSPVNCLALKYPFNGTIRLTNNQVFPASVRLQFQW